MVSLYCNLMIQKTFMATERGADRLKECKIWVRFIVWGT